MTNTLIIFHKGRILKMNFFQMNIEALSSDYTVTTDEEILNLLHITFLDTEVKILISS